MDELINYIVGELNRLELDILYYEDMGDIYNERYICDVEMVNKLHIMLRILEDNGVITLRKGEIIHIEMKKGEKE